MNEGRRGQWLPLLVWLMAMVVCAVLVARARFTADMSAFLPKAPTPEQQLLVDQLSEGVVSRLMLMGIEGGDPAFRAAISRRMAAKLRPDRRFVAASNGQSESLQADQAFLFEHRYQLSPAVTSERFTVAGLRAGVQDSLDLLASPAGLLVKEVLPRDPTGEIVVLLEHLGTESAAARNRPNTIDGVWASRDGTRALMLLQTRASGGDIDGQQDALRAVELAFAEAQSAVQLESKTTSSAKLLLTGPGVFGVGVRKLIEGEVTRLSIAGATVIIVMLLALYRSVPALLLGLLPVASGVLVAVAAVSLWFGTVHGLTLGFGTTLIGEAVDYSIYFFVQSGQARSSREEWIRGFWPTIRLGVLTSIFGFSALLFSGFPGLAQLGLYSITGLATAALVTRFILPRLLRPDFVVREMPALGGWLARQANRAGVLRWLVTLLVALSALVLLVHRNTLWNHELAALSPVSASDQALDQLLRADLGAPDVRSLVVISGATQDQVLASAERAAEALKPLAQKNVIGGVESPSHLLPSAGIQQQRLAAIPPPDELARRLQEALSPLPLRMERLGPFLADAEKARNSMLVQRADLEGTTLAVAVDGMLVHHRGQSGTEERWSAFLPLHAPRPAAGAAPGGNAAGIDAAAVKAALATQVAAQNGTRTVFVDLKSEADALYSGYLRQATLLSLAGVLSIMLLIALSLRSLTRMIGVMAPLLATVITVMGLLALAGQRLTILHLVGILLVVAVGSNYALFFNSAKATRRDAAVPERGISGTTLTSLLFANLTTVAGFGVLAFSQVPVLNAIGMTVGPGAILALLFAAIFNAPRRVAASP
ncbi:MAG: MMPL family transporter [Ramlibacter sp.]